MSARPVGIRYLIAACAVLLLVLIGLALAERGASARRSELQGRLAILLAERHQHSEVLAEAAELERLKRRLNLMIGIIEELKRSRLDAGLVAVAEPIESASELRWLGLVSDGGRVTVRGRAPNAAALEAARAGITTSAGVEEVVWSWDEGDDVAAGTFLLEARFGPWSLDEWRQPR